MTSHSETLEPGAAVTAALEHAARGWPVFPCRPQSKRPATAHGLKDATTESGLIRGWWEQWPDANVAVRTGDGRFVLDIDAGDGVDSFADDLLHKHGAGFCDTVSARTPRGGYHLWYRATEPVRNSASKVAPGIDIRGTGGYIITPPSVVADRVYEWIHPPAETEIAAAPDWLLERLAQPEPAAAQARGSTYWRDLAANGVSEGARNDSCARLAGHLLARGVDPFVCLELVTAWDQRRNRPPLGADETAQVVRSIARREAERWR
jgi:Bifunctional DNA primase/polymerase, N-terminal/Primase C terminal 1 (PriCT-1)